MAINQELLGSYKRMQAELQEANKRLQQYERKYVGLRQGLLDIKESIDMLDSDAAPVMDDASSSSSSTSGGSGSVSGGGSLWSQLAAAATGNGRRSPGGSVEGVKGERQLGAGCNCNYWIQLLSAWVSCKQPSKSHS